MDYIIKGDSDCPMLEVRLSRGEEITLESGAMVFMQDVELTGGLNSKQKGLSGLLGAIGRSLTSGESMFITTAKGTIDEAIIGIAPACPGKIVKLEVDGNNQYRLNTGAFVCCDKSLTYEMRSQDLSKALFSRTGGLFVMETTGYGDLFVSAFGDILELEVTPDKPMIIDNEHVVAWDASLEYHIEVASGIFGFTSGEGLVNKFSGSGKVLIQTRNIHSLANQLIPYIPTSTSSN